ncbi:hypothetical protein H072_4403 [Dactylellina haptotyla CBS 200.50]|uniref:Uncharacterized protein n=1 Tax=Dactylellina haptotyla (strain CBS 200.50) TaxID=1284197 RepID=S8BQH0_DACHA|nr:hypothetical protein H072_4403 [Dactylellina haptotyla CBS 200.50]
MAANHDPGEGPSTSTPRFQLGRNHRGRLSLVSDGESIDGDAVHKTREGSPGGSQSAFSHDSSFQLVFQHPTTGSPTRTNASNFEPTPLLSSSPPPLPNFPTYGGLPVPSTASYGPSVPSVHGPSSSYGGGSLSSSTYGPPIPQSYGSPKTAPYGAGDMLDDRRLSFLSDPSAVDLENRDEIRGTIDTDGTLPVADGFYPREERHERSDSIRTQSSVGALGSKDPYYGPTPPPSTVPPPRIPKKSQHRLTLEVIPPSIARQLSEQSVNIIDSQGHAMRGRQGSDQTASSYAMYSPTSPVYNNRHVRFDPDSKIGYPGEASQSQTQMSSMPIPPHVIDMLRNNQVTSQSQYYGGPLQTSELSPPQYYHPRELSSPTTTTPTLTPTLTPDGKPRTWSEKVGLFDPTDKDPEKPWWKRRKGYCFWIIIGLSGLAIIIGTIVGIVIGRQVGQNKHKYDSKQWWSAKNSTDLPPPGGFLGTWAFTTQLTNTSAACAPTANGAERELWRCFPYEDPPSDTAAVWSFFISRANSSVNSTESETGNPLLISSAGNPFALSFPNQPLYLMQYPDNGTMFYQFSYNYTRTSVVTIDGQTASCEFPNSMLTATLFVNITEFKWKKADSSGNVNRGEWPGNVTITEQKFGGGRQIVCRNKDTQDVFELNALTDEHGRGDCICDYQSYEI